MNPPLFVLVFLLAVTTAFHNIGGGDDRFPAYGGDDRFPAYGGGDRFHVADRLRCSGDDRFRVAVTTACAAAVTTASASR